MPESKHTPGPAEANARLIAAAPDLLEALLAFVQWDESESDNPGEPPRGKIRAAIAKATGEKQPLE